MRCDWEFGGYRGRWSSYRCRECGVVVVNNTAREDGEFLDSRPACGELLAKVGKVKPSIREPGTGEKIVRYSRAVARWMAAGRPVRPEAEVARIYDEVCRQCDHFTRRGSCGICGCKIKRSGSALRNKLAMSTEHCPIRRW